MVFLIFNVDYYYENFCNVINQLESFKIEHYILNEYNIKGFETLKYDYLQNNSKIITLLVDTKDDCNSLQNFIFKETNINLTCIYDKKDSKNISIVFKNENNKYRFHLLISFLGEEYINMVKYLNTDQNAELFLDYYSIHNYNKPEYNISNYIELQSLITKYLINLKNQSLRNENIETKIGINSYPPFKYYNKRGEMIDLLIDLVMIFLPLSISFQFSLYTYFFMVRMIDEKEKKLNIFLERQGISKFIYYLSWFLSYSFINIFQILFLLLLIIIFNPIYNSHLFLFLINLILLYVSLFSISFFFSICINSLKKFSSIIKLYNLGSPFLGIVIVLPCISKIIKILF